jgi:hypothetical protein
MITGATGPDLTINNINASDTGFYDCLLSASCALTVSNAAGMALDNTPPVADVPSLPTLYGSCSLVATPPTATDNCAGTIYATTTDPVSYSSTGSHTITWNYDDFNGNTVSQTQTVIITDNVAPVPQVSSLPDVVSTCSATLSAPLANDDCYGVIAATTADPVTYSAQGTYLVTWTYTDGDGNTVSQPQQVIIDDNVSPVPDQVSLPTINANCSVTLTPPTATDNCAGVLTATTTDPLTYSAPGTYSVTWSYDDGNGNTETQIQQVVVADNQNPVPDISSLPQINASCSVQLVPPTATDNCTGVITATTSDPVTYNSQGNYTVTWNYDDGNGNIETQTQLVVVSDTDAPVPALSTLPDLSGSCGFQATPPAANDNCAGVVTAMAQNASTFYAPGNYVITWEYADGNGNTSSQTQNVVITDNSSPVPDQPSLNPATGTCQVSLVPPTATDNCAGSVTATTSDPTNYSAPGQYTVTWTYSDGNGNTATQQQQVTVTGLDNSVTVNGPAIVSNATGVSYQWLDCNASYAAISNQNAATFFPTASGYYAVRINDGNCVDTSACQYVSVSPSGVNEISDATPFEVFPNPSHGEFYINATADEKINSIAVYNLVGEKILETSAGEMADNKLTLNNSPGVYYLKIRSARNVYSLPLLIQK